MHLMSDLLIVRDLQSEWKIALDQRSSRHGGMEVSLQRLIWLSKPLRLLTATCARAQLAKSALGFNDHLGFVRVTI